MRGFGLAAAVSLAVFLPTGMLVTAGFTFNETFLYWFPNFGFSALLLIFILIIHLTGDWAIQIAQRLFCSIAVIGLFIIILVGMLSQIDAPPEISTAAQNPQYFKLFAGSLLLFLGGWHSSLRGISPVQLFLIFLSGALLLGLWQLVALKYVTGVKLATSTIPYIYIAREVMGQSGRVLIGITIIAGTCAAVNYFFSLAARQVDKLLDSILTRENNKEIIGRLIAFLLSITIAFCMATGLAGDSHLETYIYASLLLWFMSVTAQVSFGWLRTRKIIYSILPAIFIFTALYLTMTHEEIRSLVIFTSLALIPSFTFTTAVIVLGRRTHQ